MTQGRYHITKDGTVAPCHATVKPCPLGGESIHFDTQESAQAHVSEVMEEEYGLLPQDLEDDDNKQTQKPLSEDYVRKHVDEIDLYDLSHRQQMSSRFVSDYMQEMDMVYVLENYNNLTPEVRDALAYEIDLMQSPYENDDMYWHSYEE